MEEEKSISIEIEAQDNRLATFDSYYEFIGKKVFASTVIASTAGAIVVLGTGFIDYYYLEFKDPFWSMMIVRIIAAIIMIAMSLCVKHAVMVGREIPCINTMAALSATVLIYGYSYVFPNLDYLPFILIYYMFATTVIAPLLSFSGFIIPYTYLVVFSFYVLMEANAPMRTIENFVIFSVPTLAFLWVLIITQRKMSHSTYRFAFQSHINATLDGLSHLLNRRAWYAQGSLRWNEAKRKQQPLAFVMLDIDHFKRVNDTWGHECGDKVIRSVSNVLLSETRDYDIIGRLGGEEFGIILPETNYDQAVVIAERIRTAVEEKSVECHGCDVCGIKTTISIGVAQSNIGGESFDQLVARGDELLYEAKNSGRNKVCAGYFGLAPNRLTC